MRKNKHKWKTTFNFTCTYISVKKACENEKQMKYLCYIKININGMICVEKTKYIKRQNVFIVKIKQQIKSWIFN